MDISKPTKWKKLIKIFKEYLRDYPLKYFNHRRIKNKVFKNLC